MAEDTPEEPDDIETEWIDAVHDRDLRRAQRILTDGHVDVNAECFWSGGMALQYVSHNVDLLESCEFC